MNNYLWNAGMFIFNSEYMESLFKKNLPSIYTNLKNLPSIDSNDYTEKLDKSFRNCEKISIDYGIIEKCENIYVIPTFMGWDDVGTWNSVKRYLDKDDFNNVTKGNVELINCKNCLVYGEDKKVTLMNQTNMFFISSNETIIVGNMDDINTVHELKNSVG